MLSIQYSSMSIIVLTREIHRLDIDSLIDDLLIKIEIN